MNVGIVGLGLIGGSMAKSTKARTGHTVWGADLDKETMTMARMCGAIDAPLTDTSPSATVFWWPSAPPPRWSGSGPMLPSSPPPPFW